MKKGLAILLLALTALSCPAQQPAPLPAWDAAAQAAWWTKNPSPDQWPQAVADLTAQLDAADQKSGSSVFSDADFQGWLEHLEWIRLGLACPDVLADPDDLKAFIALGKEGTVAHLFVEKLDPLDVKKQALQNILELARANADDLREYAALGVAFALVFDQPFPSDWPHHQVKPEAVPIGDLDVVTRFNFYVQSNRDKKLEQDLTQLTFENLKFVVDSEVKLSELAYAQQNTISYSEFEDAFSSIKYDLTRISPDNIAFDWGFPTYTLKDIETNGGICVDQAYYAAQLGKGRGIPTLYFHGQGSDGGHAWFGYMDRSGRWNLDCGRYENQNYPKGYALDPQTWQVIDDTRLTNFFKNGETNPNYQPAGNAIAWARLNAGDPSCRKILDDARSLMPELAQTWELEGAYLENTNAADEDKKSFYQSWIDQFQTFPGMKVEGQRLLLAVLKKENDPGVHDLEQDIILQNRSSGFDEGIDAASTAIFDKINAGDWDNARLEYERTIRDFGDQGGGTLFYGVISPYVEACLKNNQVKLADDALTFAEDRMTFDSGSILGEEFDHLKTRVDDLKHAAPP
jgi:hypothetical protein